MIANPFAERAPQSSPPQITVAQVVAEMVPHAVHLTGGIQQINGFIKNLGIEYFQLFSRDIFRALLSDAIPSMQAIGASFSLIPTPLSLAYLNEVKLVNGEILQDQRVFTIGDGRRERQFPPVVLTSRVPGPLLAPILEARVELSPELGASWADPILVELCQATGLQNSLSALVEKSKVEPLAGCAVVALSPTVAIKAVPSLASGALSCPAITGIPVSNGAFRITRIQVVEPRPEEVSEILSLLGGTASVKAVVESGILTHALQYLRNPHAVDRGELVRISECLHEWGMSAYIGHTQEASIGLAEGMSTSSLRLRSYRAGVEAIFASVTALPCRLNIGSDLFPSPYPVWDDGNPIELAMHTLAFEFDCANHCNELLAGFPEDLAKFLDVSFSKATWESLDRWTAILEREGISGDTLEVQLGGKINLTVRRTNPSCEQE